ncbi:Metallo-peptidase family M12B Reprolysin-like-domain-containing protein [Syncephalis pseudoplumigaleata]|uniref:Disintegrin and metalloproteinase domain-containing protein B n=1 Tax=Syncephalis pseudoplumigaleata TaxID=1712513 RepID=A0A4P9Z1W0_9FUNG|nr:Metallo-peptidase family M12B Reprolysin-like-domain-containing protein [Syncephalis pseudoplumigaleata]|eukprot:RKP26487.1 Metallo-peptidase family M12B Reprolysin-like-domain-containing protein [Syncephalis pseudoplumigaleata]
MPSYAHYTAHSDVRDPGQLTHMEFVHETSIDLLPRAIAEAHKTANPHAALVRRSSMLAYAGPSPIDEAGQPATRRDIDPQLRHDDAFRLRFRAYNQTFHLHLRPHTELLHPDARIRLHQPDGSVKEEPLRAEDVRVYTGVVVRPSQSDRRLHEDALGVVRLRIEDKEHLDPFSEVIGWARILVHDDQPLTINRPHRMVYEGAFTANGEMYNIMATSTFRRSKRPEDPEIVNPSARSAEYRRARMVIFRDSDKKVRDRVSGIMRMASEMRKPHGCGADQLRYNERMRDVHAHEDLAAYEPHARRLLSTSSPLHTAVLRRRQITRNRSCPTAKKILYMGAAADCTYVKKYKSQVEARKRILSDWGLASAVYERTFNVQLGLIMVEVRDPTCPATPAKGEEWNRDCSDTYTINHRLNDFSRWRGARGNDGAGLWHLVTQCSTGTKIGVAWLGALCQTNAQVQEQDIVSGTGVSSIAKDGWKVIAHEIGHNFGARHDCTKELCPCGPQCGCCPCEQQCDCDGQYLMNPTSDVKSSDFSPCSVRDICNYYPSASSCLQDPGSKKVLTVAMCGNGIKEGDEECDCGTEETCANDKCCTSACKLKPNAKCSDRNDECCKDCQIKSANTVCRPSISECDIQEDPTQSNRCLILSGQLLDGSECGMGGRCEAGACKGSSFVNGIKAFFKRYSWLPIVLGVLGGISAQPHPFAQPVAQSSYVDPTPYNGPMPMQPLPPAAQTGRPPAQAHPYGGYPS